MRLNRLTSSVYLFILLFGIQAQLSSYAATGGGGGLPWESPLQQITNSLQGPVAASISVIALIISGATLAFGGELNEFARRIIIVVMAISLLAFAVPFVTSLFGTGALIR